MDLNFTRTALVSALLFTLTGCGGGGSDDDNTATPVTPPPTGSGSGWQQGVFADSGTYIGQCNDLDEKFWLRSWSNETYLWYDEITDRDPASISGVIEYFDLLKTEELTESGAPKDNFHFSIPTDEYQQQQQSGSVLGYGMNVRLIRSAPPREIVVTYTETGSQAEQAGVERGWEIVAIDGADAVNGNDVDTLNNGLFPTTAGVDVEFTFLLRGSTEQQIVTLTSADVTQDSVMNVKTIETDTAKVGYLQFNDHNVPAERELYDAFNQLAQEDVNELVLDMRYNGGGLLAMASQLGYMVAGSANTDGIIFEETIFNDKNPTTNPVTGETLRPFPFFDVYIAFDPDSGVEQGTPLPSLDLDRVYVLTTGNTCSASEALINGLRGIPEDRGFEVVIVGDGTCGKPYGFYPTDNCDTTYFTIQFTGVNNDGFGEYSEGFAPQNITASDRNPVLIDGCAVADDYNHLLGDPNEALLSAALEHSATGACPAPNSASGVRGYSVDSQTHQAGDPALAIGDTRWQTQLRNNRVMSR